MIKWYAETAFHQWWVDNVWKPTWTKITTAIYGIPAALTTVGLMASNFLNDNTIQSYLSYMSIPNWVPMGLAGIALIHYMASGHD
jgi:hypothetical protein